MLRQVAFCQACDKPMYGSKEKDRSYAYYRCLSCNLRIHKDKMDGFAEKCMLSEDIGNRKLRRRQLVEGDNHGQEIAALEIKLETLRDIPEVDASPVEEKLSELKALPHIPDRWEWIQTGQTVAAYWETLDSEGKGQFLRDWRVKLWVRRDGAKLATGWLSRDEDTFDIGAVA